MHLRHIKVRNIRSIRSLDWQLPDSKRGAGWHVVVGENGSGKSSLLRATALALIGPRDALALRLPWDEWLRRRAKAGSIDLRINVNPDYDKLVGERKMSKSAILGLGVGFMRSGGSGQNTVEIRALDESRAKPAQGVWGANTGWFCAAYGPFRRFTGEDNELRSLSRKMPKLARCLSIFDEGIALSESLEWLQQLKFKSLEIAQGTLKSKEMDILPAIIKFINQPEFLPFHARLVDINSDSVRFVDGNDMDVRIEDLSDGYRSILSMTFDLIRQLADVFGHSRLFDPQDPTRVLPSGVVLIDEIDVHLHPTWQQRVGFWFCKHFPNIQFLVTTHSPLICQAAGLGSIYLLPRPGEDEAGGMLQGTKLKRLIDGNVLDAYGTEVFGKGVTRSQDSKAKLRRLAELNALELTQALTTAQKKEQEKLRGSMPTASGVLGPSK